MKISNSNIRIIKNTSIAILGMGAILAMTAFTISDKGLYGTIKNIEKYKRDVVEVENSRRIMTSLESDKRRMDRIKRDIEREIRTMEKGSVDGSHIQGFISRVIGNLNGVQIIESGFINSPINDNEEGDEEGKNRVNTNINNIEYSKDTNYTHYKAKIEFHLNEELDHFIDMLEIINIEYDYFNIDNSEEVTNVELIIRLGV